MAGQAFVRVDIAAATLRRGALTGERIGAWEEISVSGVYLYARVRDVAKLIFAAWPRSRRSDRAA